ncbi:MAG: LacI family DNA-binding transcriptional regulator [Flavobacteriaceae bacterium]|nr:LacI family DNA-binding transcriptional regulator [Flavobacteriaceae bacterium]
MEEKVTLKELARILGVSIATVSKALNDNYDISEGTKERIRAKAKEMNYVPNVIAQSLKLKRTFNLGVIIPNITDYFFARALRGITKEAKENKFKVVISISNEELQNEVDSVNLLLNSRVDGILMSLSK